MLLELNDVALTLREQGSILYQEPAHALVTEGALVFGSAALAGSRLHPLESNNSYLDKLSTEPLPRALAGARTYADLVYQHLLELAPVAESAQLCISVGGNVGNEQLAILLGIAKEAGLSVGSLVDSAVLASSAQAADATLTYVDISLHHLSLTRLQYDNDSVTRDSQQLLIGCGAQGIMDGWTQLIADQFVQATRFDPLHSAASEQQLINQLNRWRQTDPAQANELPIDIELGNDARRTVVAVAALEAKTANRLQPLAEAMSSNEQVLLSTRAASFPGLATLLQSRVASVQIETSDHVPHAMQAQQTLFETADSVRFFTSLGCKALHSMPESALPATATSEPEHTPALPASTPAVAPTHVLCDGVARSIDTCLLELQLPLARSGEQFRVMPSARPLLGTDGQPLPEGDVLHCGQPFSWNSAHYTLIAVQGS